MQTSGENVGHRQEAYLKVLRLIPKELRHKLLKCQPCPFCQQYVSGDGARDHIIRETYCFLMLGIVHGLPELSAVYIQRQFPRLEFLTLQTVTAFFLGRPRIPQSQNEDDPFMLAYANLLQGVVSPNRENKSSQQREASFFRCIQLVMARGSACIAFFLGFWALAFPEDKDALKLFRQLGESAKTGEEAFSKSTDGFKKLFMANAQIQHNLDCGPRPSEPCDWMCTSSKPVLSFRALRDSYEKHFTRSSTFDSRLGVILHIPRKSIPTQCIFHEIRGRGGSAVNNLGNILRGIEQVNKKNSSGRDAYLHPPQPPVHEFQRFFRDIFLFFKIFFLATVLTEKPALLHPSYLGKCCAASASCTRDDFFLCCGLCIRGTPVEAVHNVMKQFDQKRIKLLNKCNAVAKTNLDKKNSGDVKKLVNEIAKLLRAYHPTVSLEPIQCWFSEDDARQVKSWPELQKFILKTTDVVTSTTVWHKHILNHENFKNMFNVFLTVEAECLSRHSPAKSYNYTTVKDFVGRVLDAIDVFAARARVSGGPLSPDGERAETSKFSQSVIQKNMGVFEMTYLCAAFGVMRCVQEVWQRPGPLLQKNASPLQQQREEVLQVLRERRFPDYAPFFKSLEIILQKKMDVRFGSPFHELQHPTDVQRIREMGYNLKEKIMALVHGCSALLRFFPEQLVAENITRCPLLVPPPSGESRGFIPHEEHLATIAFMMLPHLMKGLLGPCLYTNCEKIERELFCPVTKSCLNLRGLQRCKVCESATLCSRCSKDHDVCPRCADQEKESRQETKNTTARTLIQPDETTSSGLGEDYWHEELTLSQLRDEAPVMMGGTYDFIEGSQDSATDSEFVEALQSVDVRVGLLQEFEKKYETVHEFRSIEFFRQAAFNLDNFGTKELMRLYDILYILLAYLLQITKGRIPAGAVAQSVHQEPDPRPPCNGRCLDRTSSDATNSEQLRKKIQNLLDTFSCTEPGVVGIKDPYMVRLCVNVYIAAIDCERHRNLFLKVLLEDEFLRHVDQIHCRSNNFLG